MSTMNISLPESMREWVEQQVAEGGYSSVSEYIRELVRLDKRRKASERLDVLLREGFESGPPIPGDDAFGARKRAEADELLAKHNPEQ
ncbi:MAG: type II toxin-antitoxin system ParD family antitoxin [Candidatus Hydrogenedentota bacterium]